MTKILANLFDALTLIGALFGCLILLGAFSPAASAPQEAVLAAMAIAVGALPYMLAGAFHRATVRAFGKESWLGRFAR